MHGARAHARARAPAWHQFMWAATGQGSESASLDAYVRTDVFHCSHWYGQGLVSRVARSAKVAGTILRAEGDARWRQRSGLSATRVRSEAFRSARTDGQSKVSPARFVDGRTHWNQISNNSIECSLSPLQLLLSSLRLLLLVRVGIWPRDEKRHDERI